MNILSALKERLSDNKTPDIPDGISYKPSPEIKINGQSIKIKISSLQTYRKMEELQRKIDSSMNNIGESPEALPEMVEAIKDFVLLLLGADGYSLIFDTDEKKDDWKWHLQVFWELFRCVVQAQLALLQDSTNSTFVQQIKKKGRKRK